LAAPGGREAPSGRGCDKTALLMISSGDQKLTRPSVRKMKKMAMKENTVVFHQTSLVNEWVYYL
jgi:hypothetical protein